MNKKAINFYISRRKSSLVGLLVVILFAGILMACFDNTDICPVPDATSSANNAGLEEGMYIDCEQLYAIYDQEFIGNMRFDGDQIVTMIFGSSKSNTNMLLIFKPADFNGSKHALTLTNTNPNLSLDTIHYRFISGPGGNEPDGKYDNTNLPTTVTIHDTTGEITIAKDATTSDSELYVVEAFMESENKILTDELHIEILEDFSSVKLSYSTNNKGGVYTSSPSFVIIHGADNSNSNFYLLEDINIPISHRFKDPSSVLTSNLGTGAITLDSVTGAIVIDTNELPAGTSELTATLEFVSTENTETETVVGSKEITIKLPSTTYSNIQTFPPSDSPVAPLSGFHLHPNNPTKLYITANDTLYVYSINLQTSSVSLENTISNTTTTNTIKYADILIIGNMIYMTDLANNLLHSFNTSLITGATITIPSDTRNGTTENDNTKFSSPSALAKYKNDLYIADKGNHRIMKLTNADADSADDETAILSVFATDIGDSDGPDALAIDAAGNIFASVSAEHVIYKIDENGVATIYAGDVTPGNIPDGNTVSTSTIQDARFDTPKSLAFDDAGKLYVADSGNNKIKIITPRGLVTNLQIDDGAGGTTTTITSTKISIEDPPLTIGDSGNTKRLYILGNTDPVNYIEISSTNTYKIDVTNQENL